jgi:hypothetical protein
MTGLRTGSRTQPRPAVRREAEEDWGKERRQMKTRTHFAHRIDMLDDQGEILEHLASVELWPKSPIMLRQGARVVLDSRKPRIVKG